MKNYKIHFHRYFDGEARISGAQFIHAADFAAAHQTAEAILMGLRGADTQAEFSIVSIEAYGARGKECNGGHMFETIEELELRCSEV